MRISLKIEYSCRVLAQLGRFYGSDKLAHIEDLATAEEIPSNYLVQILNELRNGGLINSKRGKQGGYALAKAPDTITLYDIVGIIDPDMFDSEPSTRGQSGDAVAQIWNEISGSLSEKIRSFTLKQFIDSTNADNYVI